MKQDLALKSQVKKILKLVQEIAPGNSLELRVPPYAAIQCIPGSVHRRGTPPNVVEMSGDTLLKLVKDPTGWEKFCSEGLISASGIYANLEDLFTQASKLATSSK
jgi:hypothetical protein